MPTPKRARSGGPKTLAGRALSAGNSLKTGAYSAQTVLPGENAKQFEDLEQQLVQEFEPVGMAEAAMVHDLAVLTWKKLRVNRVEHAVMSQMLLIKLPQDRLESAFGPGLMREAMHRLDPYKPVTEEEFKTASDLLEQIHAADDDEKGRHNPATFRRKWPLLYAALESWAEELEFDVEGLISGQGDEEPNLDKTVGDIFNNLQPVIWMWENREKIHKAVHQARDAKLMEFIRSAGGVTQRALDDIGRAFYRTLSELRRQQDWRQLRNALTVEDVNPKTD